jgi:hypothetical protein
MFCQKCGAEIPDNSTFCRQGGAPVAVKASVGPPTAGTPAIFSNLAKTLKCLVSKKPEDGITIAAGSKSFEWAIILGANVFFFMFAFAIVGACLKLNFGFHLLFGFLIALIANGLMFGALFLLLTLMRKKLPFVGLLNLYAYTTIPLTAAALLSMPFAPAWHFFATVFFAIALLVQFIMIFLSLQKASDNGHVPFYLFSLVSAGTLAVLMIALYWLNMAAIAAA